MMLLKTRIDRDNSRRQAAFERLKATRERLAERKKLLEAGYMKKNLSVVVEDEDLVELIRILMDDDVEGALAFLKKHFKGKARDLLEGG